MVSDVAKTDDAVTQLQQELAHITFLLYNCIGTTQRDAGPASMKGEGLVSPPSSSPALPASGSTGYATQIIVIVCSGQTPLTCTYTKMFPEQFDQMADQLRGALKALSNTIDNIPSNFTSEDEQLGRIVELQQQNVEASRRLQVSLERAKSGLKESQALYAALAESIFQLQR